MESSRKPNSLPERTNLLTTKMAFLKSLKSRSAGSERRKTTTSFWGQSRGANCVMSTVRILGRPWAGVQTLDPSYANAGSVPESEGNMASNTGKADLLGFGLPLKHQWRDQSNILIRVLGLVANPPVFLDGFIHPDWCEVNFVHQKVAFIFTHSQKLPILSGGWPVN